MRSVKALIGLAAVLLVVGCTTPPDNLLNAANRTYMRYAMGKPYADVASLHPTTLEGLAGRTAYGPMIGSFDLADGNRVYRHIDNVQTGESSVDFGIISKRRTVSTSYRLAYFRVGPDGIVNDWAVGSLPGESLRCVSYAVGIISRCDNQQSLRQSLDFYDTLVRTSSNQPITVWGMRASENFAANSLAAE